MAIRPFKGKFVETIQKGRKVPKGFPPTFAKAARHKLAMVNAATVLSDLATPPGNRLELYRATCMANT